MSLFRVTKDVHERAKPITPGWHPGAIHKIEDGETAKKEPKTTFTFKILAGKDAGKFASKMVMHDTKETSYLHYNLDFLEFMSGKKLDGREVDLNLTVANVVQQCDILVENREFNGIIMANVIKVRPLTKK